MYEEIQHLPVHAERMQCVQSNTHCAACALAPNCLHGAEGIERVGAPVVSTLPTS
jgi:hypothetical protein